MRAGDELSMPAALADFFFFFIFDLGVRKYSSLRTLWWWWLFAAGRSFGVTRPARREATAGEVWWGLWDVDLEWKSKVRSSMDIFHFINI